MKEIVFAWSGGKDSALALYELLKNKQNNVVGLLTTLTTEFNRTLMHGVRSTLMDAQANMLKLPLHKVYISANATEAEYEAEMASKMKEIKAQGVAGIAFGDIFLEDLKEHRENKLRQIDLDAIFPIWKQDTQILALRFINLGFKAIVTCVDSKYLDASFVGREYNANLYLIYQKEWMCVVKMESFTRLYMMLLCSNNQFL